MNSSINDFDFTDDEIREQLELLGFKNVSQSKFNSFKEDLRKLIENERSSEESQIFNQRLNRIQREKLNNFGQELSDDDDYGQESSVASNNRDYDYSNGSSNYKFIKRKVARKISTSPTQSSNNFIGSRSYSNINHSENESDSLEINIDAFDKNLKIKNSDTLDLRYTDKVEAFKDTLDHPIDHPLKSFIRPLSSQSSLKFEDPSRIRKSNPVRLYHDYNKIWKKQKAPGEKSHKDLRWSIREKMLEKHVIVKKQPIIHQENSYQVPSEKKRQDLIWVIRNSMANAK